MFPPPTIAPPPLEDYQFYYNGLTFGADTPWGVLKVEGLDLADIRNGDASWPRDHGQAAGLDVYAGRDVIIDLWMKSDGVSLQSSQLQLARATVVQPGEELLLWFKLPELPPLCIFCRPRKRPLPIDADYAAASVAKPELTLHATDPRIYNTGEASSIEMGEPPSTPATAELFNEGNTEMCPIAVFTGPIARPKIGSNVAGEPSLEFVNTDAEREEETANEAIFLKEVRRWEQFPDTAPLYSAFVTYKKGDFVHTPIGATIVYYECIKEGSKGKFPETSPEDWEELPHGKEKFTRAEITAREEVLRAAQEAEETAAAEARKVEEEKGELPTVKAGDQLVVDMGTPHRAILHPGGIESGEPTEDVLRWLTPDSTWWDIVPDSNVIGFSSIDEKATAGHVEIQWASARQL